MSAYLRRRALSRRRFLRGGTAMLALPFLDAMVPAFARTTTTGPEAAPLRCLFVFAPNGKRMDLWTPKRSGRGYDLSPTLEGLGTLKDRVSVYSGLAIDGGRAHGDGPGDHARAASSFLTCAHPRKTGGADIQVGVSVDQIIAERIGTATDFPSLELGIDRGRRAGSCDSGYSCAYSNNVSWKSPSTPVAKETRPIEVFKRLFGNPEDVRSEAERARKAKVDRSILDSILADAKSLRRDLVAADRAKIDEYLEAVRDLERRIARTSGQTAGVPGAESIIDGGSSRDDRIRQMFDLIALAFQTDRTRCVTFMLGNAGANESFPFVGVSDGHHDSSHHGKDEGKLDAIAKIDRFHVDRFAAFLDRMAKTAEGEKDLLARSIVLYGSGIGDGDRHNHDDLPILLAGEAGGKARPGRHEKLPHDTPMANLHLAILQAMGIEAASFADSKQALSL